jgi:hypothetical protein
MPSFMLYSTVLENLSCSFVVDANDADVMELVMWLP